MQWKAFLLKRFALLNWPCGSFLAAPALEIAPAQDRGRLIGFRATLPGFRGSVNLAITCDLMFGDESSAFWFYGRLSPGVEVPAFFAQEIPVSPHVRIEIALEHLGVWARPGTRVCKQPGEVTQLAQLVVGAWALLSGKALSWTFDGWVEATQAQLDGSIMGHVNPHHREGANEESDDSKRVRAAAELAVQLRARPAYRLALRDLRLALSDISDDAILFAYRAVENCARALAGIDGELGREGWARFHELRGIEAVEGREEMEALIRSRNAIAHGESDSGVNRAPSSHLVLQTRKLVLATLAADPSVEIPRYADHLVPELPKDDLGFTTG